MPSVSPQSAPAPQLPVSANHHQQARWNQQPGSGGSVAGHCPELVWRQVRWPQTEPGLLAQMPCPAHAHSLEPYAASLACLAGGHWARRVQANRCQSLWLRNLTQRLEAGDSALSVAAELVQRTRQPAAAAAAASQLMSGPNGGLFGQDLAAIGRAVQRIVASTAELLIRIQDDKQRVAFAREIVQSLVELINNLALETHLDAWLDLDAQPGERQRISGQLVQSLESASVLLASTLSQPANEPQQQPQQADSFVKTSESAYVTVRTLNLAAGGQLNSSYSSSSSSSADGRAREIEVAFPNEASLLGTKWMNSMPQKFTLHLQTSLASGGGGTELTTPADPFQAGNQNLKIVFVMLKGIGAQMEQQQQQQPAPQVELPDSAAAAAQPSSSSRLVVNSNLVSLSIVADQRYTIKVDLSAPIELVFKHLELVKSMKSAPHCVYWDTTISDWLSDGCKLIDSNRTHSTCACSHLTTFALLTSSDDLMLPTRHHHQQQQQQQQPQLPPLLHHDQPQQPSLNHYQQQQQQPALLTKVQLDSVENELILPAFAQSGESSQLPTQQQQQQPASKLLYLIKMLNGHLFDSPATYGNGNNNNTANNPAAILNPRLLVYISCLVSALLLALHLVAVAYNRAHTRRLLGSMPAEPPPPLLVTNGQQQPPLRLASNSSRYQQQQHHGGSSLETTPTYGSAIETSATASDYLAAAATAIKPQPSYFDLQPVSFKRQFQVPTHILIQLLLLQVLLILLVESQNYIHQMRLDSFHSIQSLNDNNYGGPMMTMMMIVAMNPIGPITWFLVGLLYYLIGCLTFWLASQLIKLDLNLAGLASFAAAPVGPSETGAGWCSSSQSKPPVQSIFAPASISSTQSRDSPTDSTDGVKYGPPSTIYGGPPQRTTLNLYGGAPPASVCYGTGFGAGINNPLQQATATAAGGNNVTSDCSPGSSFSAGSALGNTKRPLSALLSHLLNPAIGRPLHLVLVHLCPVLCVSAIVWLSSPRVSWFNSLTFTSSFGFQLVYWPLLIDLTSSALSILLYYIPAVCLVLFCVAVFLLRACSKRQQRQQLFAGFVSHSEDLISSEAPNSNGHADDGPLNSMMTTIHHHHRQLPPTSGGGGGGDSSSMRKSTPAASVNPYGSSALVQQACSMTSSSSAANPREPQSIPLAAALNKQHQQQQRRQQSRKAAYCTSDNRCALQRWQANDLKKAKFVCAILAALLALHSICWISFFAYLHEALNSPPPSAGSSSPSSGGGQHLMYAFASSNLALVLLIGWSQRRTLRRSAQLTGLTRLLGGLAALFGCSAGDRSMAAARRRARLYQRAQRAQTGSQTLAGKPGPAGGIKVSPSNQSLFLVSSQRPPAAHLAGSNYQQPAAYGSAGAAAYSSSSAAQQQQQQHLYQQLSDQQQQQHIYDSTSALNAGPAEQLNVMQLMHQQQVHRQQQQQHEQFATMHSHQPRNHPFHLQQQQHARHPMTLRPMGFERQQVDLSVAHMNPLMLDQVCQRQQQQQQQQTGEADGPLVAFSSCSSSSDSSGQPAQPVASSHQQQQQQATFGPIATPISQQQHSRQPRSGPQLFDQQQQQQQHQYYSINSPQGGRPAQQPHHFRRADSRQSRQRAANCLDASQSNVIDCVGEAPNSISGRGQPMGATDSKGNNIYDVANYALNQ